MILGFRVGFGVEGSGVQILGFRVQGLGFGVEGLGPFSWAAARDRK